VNNPGSVGLEKVIVHNQDNNAILNMQPRLSSHTIDATGHKTN